MILLARHKATEYPIYNVGEQYQVLAMAIGHNFVTPIRIRLNQVETGCRAFFHFRLFSRIITYSVPLDRVSSTATTRLLQVCEVSAAAQIPMGKLSVVNMDSISQRIESIMCDCHNSPAQAPIFSIKYFI